MSRRMTEDDISDAEQDSDRIQERAMMFKQAARRRSWAGVQSCIESIEYIVSDWKDKLKAAQKDRS